MFLSVIIHTYVATSGRFIDVRFSFVMLRCDVICDILNKKLPLNRFHITLASVLKGHMQNIKSHGVFYFPLVCTCITSGVIQNVRPRLITKLVYYRSCKKLPCTCSWCISIHVIVRSSVATDKTAKTWLRVYIHVREYILWLLGNTIGSVVYKICLNCKVLTLYSQWLQLVWADVKQW